MPIVAKYKKVEISDAGVGWVEEEGKGGGRGSDSPERNKWSLFVVTVHIAEIDFVCSDA